MSLLEATGADLREYKPKEPHTYNPESRHSFFADMASAKFLHDDEARSRLERHQLEVRVDQGLESRANPNNTVGFGGEFDPPGWLISSFKTASRAGRTLGDLVPNIVLPPGVSSVNVPKVLQGFLTGIQAGEGEADIDQDATSQDLSSQVVTIAGQADVAQQLVDMVPADPGFDAVIYRDLMLDYNQSLELQLISGSGINGQLLGLANFSIPSTNTISGTGATSLGAFWPLPGEAMAAVGNGRRLQPEAVLMAIRRWGWLTSQLDNSGRPVTTPSNHYDISATTPAGGYGPVGALIGLPVFLDGALLSVATNADAMYFVRPSDMLLYESTKKFMASPNPLSSTLQMRYTLRTYCAFVGNPYSSALAVITNMPQPSGY